MGSPIAPSSTLFGPFSISYSAVDGSGNQAPAQTRMITVDAGCPDGQERCPDLTCPDAGSGLCITLLTAALDTATPEYVPPVDTTAPVLSPVVADGDVIFRIAAVGVRAIVQTTVLVGTRYVDAGAFAEDDLDGDVTGSLSVSGLKLLSTAVPTAEDAPHLVKYSVADRAGNIAYATRRVFVECPAPEEPCADTNTGELTGCTTAGLCVSYGDEVAELAEVLPAVIELVGPAIVQLAVGDTYEPCPTIRPVSLVCDQVRMQHASPP